MLDFESPALRPAHSRCHRISLSEGFSHFVTSIAAPVASGWSVCRVGFAPTGKRRLLTAHAKSRHRLIKKYADRRVICGTAEPVAIRGRDLEDALEIRRFRCILIAHRYRTADIAKKPAQPHRRREQ